MASSTLSEVTITLAKVIYAVMSKLDNEAWVDTKQVVYSTSDEWDTAYSSFLRLNKVKDVKFPFASLTRNSSQETQMMPRRSLQVTGNTRDAKIKPTTLTYTITIYEKELSKIEAIVNSILLNGMDDQRVDFDSKVLGAPSSLRFALGEPEHSMVPTKDDKVSGHGFIYSLSIPMTVWCTLGVSTEQKLIKQIISSTYLDDIKIDESIIQ